jgi:hypothetical protein
MRVQQWVQQFAPVSYKLDSGNGLRKTACSIKSRVSTSSSLYELGRRIVGHAVQLADYLSCFDRCVEDEFAIALGSASRTPSTQIALILLCVVG